MEVSWSLPTHLDSTVGGTTRRSDASVSHSRHARQSAARQTAAAEDYTLAFMDQMERSAYETLWVWADLGNRILREAAQAFERHLKRLSSLVAARGGGSSSFGQSLAHVQQGCVAYTCLFYTGLAERQRTSVRLQRIQQRQYKAKNEWMWAQQGGLQPRHGEQEGTTVTVENLPAAWSPARADCVARVFGDAESVALRMPCEAHSPEAAPSAMTIVYRSRDSAERCVAGLHSHVMDASPVRARPCRQSPLALRSGAASSEEPECHSHRVAESILPERPASPSKDETAFAQRATLLAQELCSKEQARLATEEDEGLPLVAAHRQLRGRGASQGGVGIRGVGPPVLRTPDRNEASHAERISISDEYEPLY